MVTIDRAKEHCSNINIAVRKLNEVIQEAAADKVSTELEIRNVQSVASHSTDIVEAHVTIPILHLEG